MKKLLIVVAIVAAGLYMNRSSSKASRAAAPPAGPKAARPSLDAPTPNGAVQAPLKGDPLADRERLRQQAESAAAAKAANANPNISCTEVREIIAGGEVFTTPLSGGKAQAVKVTSPQMKTEYEDYYKAHCMT